MGKYTNFNRLSSSGKDELFIRFAQAIATLKNSIEVAEFVKDLLSEEEVWMLARRLKIAELLQEGLTYQQIRKVIKVSDTTIAKVHTWLKTYGEGYRTVIARIKKYDPKPADLSSPWRKLKQSYPMYYWPELLLEQIVSNASKREKERLRQTVQELKGKTKLAKQLKLIFQSDKHYHSR